MKNADLLSKANYEKITMRHLGLKNKTEIEPLTGKDICMIRGTSAHEPSGFCQISQLNGRVRFSQLERGSKRPIGAALVLLNVIHRKGIEVDKMYSFV